MSQIIFYTNELEEAVNNFMTSIQDDQDKARRFITFDTMAQRTKVTLESSASEIVSSMVTLASVIEVNIFVPWMSLIRGSLKEYIENNNVENVSYRIAIPEGEETPKLLSGETKEKHIIIIPGGGMDYTMFFPEAAKVLYLLPVSAAEELLKTATENTRVSVDLDTLKAKTDITTEQVAISIPQLSTVSWVDLFKYLENDIKNETMEVVYVETVDMITESVSDYIKKLDTESKIKIVIGEQSLINTYEEESAPEETPAVEAEVVE